MLFNKSIRTLPYALRYRKHPIIAVDRLANLGGSGPGKAQLPTCHANVFPAHAKRSIERSYARIQEISNVDEAAVI